LKVYHALLEKMFEDAGESFIKNQLSQKSRSLPNVSFVSPAETNEMKMADIAKMPALFINPREGLIS